MLGILFWLPAVVSLVLVAGATLSGAFSRRMSMLCALVFLVALAVQLRAPSTYIWAIGLLIHARLDSVR